MPARARLEPADVAGPERVVIELDEPTEGVAPGQAAVLYDGTRVIGSATIGSATIRRAERADAGNRAAV